MQFCGSKRSDLILKVCYDKQNLFYSMFAVLDIFLIFVSKCKIN